MTTLCSRSSYRRAAHMCILLETHLYQKLNFSKSEFFTDFSTAGVEVFTKMFRTLDQVLGGGTSISYASEPISSHWAIISYARPRTGRGLEPSACPIKPS